MSDRVKKFANVAIDDINSLFHNNPKDVFFEIETPELKSVDDINFFIKEWNKRMDCAVYITPLEGGSYRVYGDIRIKSKIINHDNVKEYLKQKGYEIINIFGGKRYINFYMKIKENVVCFVSLDDELEEFTMANLKKKIDYCVEKRLADLVSE
jgi:hypothetical protein